MAPSAVNRQPWHFTVVTNNADIATICRAYNRDWIQTANTFIIVSGSFEAAWTRPYDAHNHVDVDIAIATEHICLKATDLGLNTCWVCNFDPEIVVAGIELPQGFEPKVIIPIGKAADDVVQPEKTRKDFDQIVTWH